MKIYVALKLIDDEYFYYGFDKAFSTKEKAQAYIDTYPYDKEVPHWNGSGRTYPVYKIVEEELN